MKKARVLSTVLSIVMGITSVISMTSIAETSTEPTQKTAIGTVSLRYGKGKGTKDIEQMPRIEAGEITTDGKYDMTWNVKDMPDFGEAEDIYIEVERIKPYFLGKYRDVKFSIGEIWLDGEKYDIPEEIKTNYGYMTDTSIGTADIWILTSLKNSDIPDFKADDTVRVVFSISGLAVPDTTDYKQKHEGTPIGTACLEYKTDREHCIEGIAISDDGNYVAEWDLHNYPEIADSTYLNFTIQNIEPFELGEQDKVTLTVNEIYQGGFKYFGKINPSIYIFGTDGYHNGNIIKMSNTLRNSSGEGIWKEVPYLVVKFTVNGLTSPDSEHLLGDVNGDKLINAVDSSLVLAHYANISTNKTGIFSSEQSDAADVNGDNVINAVDAATILSCYAKLATVPQT
ncbi:MAG: hypothetical protein IKW96_10290 [Ruminococcus sp.]|uniref:dockerin type I domain-containing protein n=1 Tax=Ruminococcus sp. TaxID=41978 RepID=UPI0025D5C96C|nr:dockerin type I domain-containing protein [Ruminococcus sp.]MBR5683640.1 hypothetical protein [Ruminococcus sp.]